MVSILSWSH